MRYLLIILLVCSFTSHATTFCSDDKTTRVKKLKQILKSAHTFNYIQHDDGITMQGFATGQSINGRYHTLKFNPENGEGGFFIFAHDLTNDLYWIFFTFNPFIKTTFYKGQYNDESCEFEFPLTEKGLISVKLISDSVDLLIINWLSLEEDSIEKHITFEFAVHES